MTEPHLTLGCPFVFSLFLLFDLLKVTHARRYSVRRDVMMDDFKKRGTESLHLYFSEPVNFE
jgi:hypothetical protein